MSRKKRKKSGFIVSLFITCFIVVCFIAGYKEFNLSQIDTSLNGSEIKERTQHAIPPDVAQEIESQRKLYKLTEIPTYRVPILMYHYIEYVRDPNDKTRTGLTTIPYVLEQQVKTLKNAGFTFMTAGELAQVIDGKEDIPANPIVLTFDDGYRDFYTDAYPILKKYNVPATQYVISGYLGNPNHLTVGQLQEIAKDNLVEIADHTVTHEWLKGEEPNEVAFQVTSSKTVLEKLIGKKIVSFAYPYGAFDLPAAKIVSQSGYTNAVSTIPGIIQSHENEYFLFRLRPGARMGNVLLSWLTSKNFSPY